VEAATITQYLGDRWLKEGRSLLLQVPSVFVPETWNVSLNPQHAEARSLKIVAIYEHPFGSRLL
jgi:RES domain-containing protein